MVPSSPSKRLEFDQLLRKLQDSIAGDMLKMSKKLEAGTKKVDKRVDPVDTKLSRLFNEIDNLKLGLARQGGGSVVNTHTTEQVVVDNYINSGADADALIRLERRQQELDDELLKHTSDITTLFENFANLEDKHLTLEGKHTQLEESVVNSIQKQAQEIALIISQKAEQDKAILELNLKKVCVAY
jgi:hypothetical protein